MWLISPLAPAPFNGSGLGRERLARGKHFLNLAVAQESRRHCRNFCLFYKKQVDDFGLCELMAKQQMVAMTTYPPIVQINDSTVGITMGHAASSLLDKTDDLVTRRRSQSVGKTSVLKSKNSSLLSSWLSIFTYLEVKGETGGTLFQTAESKCKLKQHLNSHHPPGLHICLLHDQIN